MEGDAEPAQAGRSATRSDRLAVAGCDHLRAERCVGHRPKDNRSYLYEAVSDAWVDRAVMRRCPIRRWRDDGMDAYARRLSRPPGYCANAAHAAVERSLYPCRRLRLLWSQRRGRCRRRCGADRARFAGHAGSPAMDARTGARLGTVRAGDGDKAEGVAG